MSTTQTRVTAHEIFDLPEINTPIQLLDGVVIINPSPTPAHQTIVANVLGLLHQITTNRAGQVFIAPMDVYLDEENVPQPDVLWLAPDSRCKVEEKRLSGPPDLIVEILSPGTARIDKRDKFRLYERHAVRELWIVDPYLKFVEIWQLIERRFVLLNVFGPDEQFESALLGTILVKLIFEG